MLSDKPSGTISKIAFILLERYTWTSIFHDGQTHVLSPYDTKELQRRITSEENMSQLSTQEWKESYMRHLFKVYSRIIEDENESRDLLRKSAQKELAALMEMPGNTLSRLLN